MKASATRRHLEEDDEGYQVLDDDEDEEDRAHWREPHPAACVDRFLDICRLTTLADSVSDKWLPNVSSLMVYLRKCYSKEFDAMQQDGGDTRSIASRILPSIRRARVLGMDSSSFVASLRRLHLLAAASL